MLAKAETDSVATTVDRWLAQFERALAERDDVLLATLFHARQPLARCAGPDLGHQNGQRLGRDRERAAGACRAGPTGRFQDSPPTDRPPPRDARGHERDRSDLPVRNRRRPRQRSAAAHPGCEPWHRAESVDIAHIAGRIKRDRGAGRAITVCGQVLFARFSRPELARPQDSRRRVCRPGSRGARCRRRTGRAFDRRPPYAIADRHAGRGP